MSPVDRIANWDSRLVELGREMVGQPFEWGTTDCVSLVRRGLTIILGADPWRGYVGTWKTRRGALGVSRRTNYKDALVSSGAVEVGIHFAWSGDVALGARVDKRGMLSMALLLPTRKVMTSGPETGVVVVDKLSLTEGTRFYRYGSQD